MPTVTFTLPDSRVLTPGQPFVLEGVQYPANWLSLATTTELADRGIVRAEILDPEPLPPTTVELATYAAARRYQVEVAGCSWGTYTVATDRESQGKMIAEFVAISGGLRTDPSPWKFKDGTFASLSNADMSAVALAARAHIANAFALEEQALAAITAATITTYAGIDALIV